MKSKGKMSNLVLNIQDQIKEMKSKEWFDEDEILWIKLKVWKSKSHLEEFEFRGYEM